MCLSSPASQGFCLLQVCFVFRLSSAVLLQHKRHIVVSHGSDYETQNSCVERTHLQLLVHAVCCCTIQAVVLNADWSVKQSNHANILLNSVVALNITRSLCTGSNYKQ